MPSDMDVNAIKRMYFIGIGGIGMSALARFFNQRGVSIWGYDKTETALTKKLVEEGMRIHYEERPDLIPDQIDLVVYTPAVPETHRELVSLREKGLPVKKRAEVLGLISKTMKTIAIAGTHGKTTTSIMVTHLLKTGGIDCSAFLGGISLNLNANFTLGQSDWVVVEADEYDRSFLQLEPEIASILSMDPDHLDVYGDHERMLSEGFEAFAKRCKPEGKLLIKEAFSYRFPASMSYSTYGVGEGDFQARGIRVEHGRFYFDFVSEKDSIEHLELGLPGRHNVENATAAVTIARWLGLNEDSIRIGLASFKGVQRRFERIYEDEHAVLIDDYAHHPTELRAAIDAARELYPGRKIAGIFQPHLFSRTRDFADGFAEALDALDEVLLMEIYPAREAPIAGVSSATILEKMKNEHKRLVEREEIPEVLAAMDFEVLLTLGAGDIDRELPRIKRALTKRT